MWVAGVDGCPRGWIAALLGGAGLPQALIDAVRPSGAGADDLVDALAGLTVALDLARGGGRSFPDPPGRDAHGLPVAIWTLRP
jgi:predicted RNase H-like nuclease